MKYYIVYYKTSKTRINGVYYDEEGFYHKKLSENKLDNFKKNAQCYCNKRTSKTNIKRRLNYEKGINS